MPEVKDVLALTDSGIARLIIAASKFERDADRVALLEKFAATSDPPRRRADNVPRSGLSGVTKVTPEKRRRSPDAERMRRYRAPAASPGLGFSSYRARLRRVAADSKFNH